MAMAAAQGVSAFAGNRDDRVASVKAFAPGQQLRTLRVGCEPVFSAYVAGGINTHDSFDVNRPVQVDRDDLNVCPWARDESHQQWVGKGGKSAQPHYCLISSHGE